MINCDSAHPEAALEKQADNAQRILMIVGCVRSGSTILGELLGTVPNHVHVGELNYIWSHGLVQNRRCGCGQPVRECEFWQKVFEVAFGGFDGVDVEMVLRAKSLLERTRTLPRLLGPFVETSSDYALKYKQVLEKLYRGIAEVSGADVVVDSSKAPPYAYLVDTIPSMDLRTIHLVRDSRAVVFSKRRRKLDPSIPGKVNYFEPEGVAYSALVWSVTNGLLDRDPPGKSSVLIRYSDFANAPQSVLSKIGDALGDSTLSSGRVSDHLDKTQPSHTISGNPVRFESHISIAPDIEWQQKMPIAQRAIVTLLTLPWLLRFGFIQHPESGRSAPEAQADSRAVHSDTSKQKA